MTSWPIDVTPFAVMFIYLGFVIVGLMTTTSWPIDVCPWCNQKQDWPEFEPWAQDWLRRTWISCWWCHLKPKVGGIGLLTREDFFGSLGVQCGMRASILNIHNGTGNFHNGSILPFNKTILLKSIHSWISQSSKCHTHTHQRQLQKGQHWSTEKVNVEIQRCSLGLWSKVTLLLDLFAL